jgi:uncharacterized protein
VLNHGMAEAGPGGGARPEGGEGAGVISIVIPALNEADSLGRTLETCRDPQVLEVIVVDGGSEDETTAIAESHGASVLTVPRPGRGIQLNAGSRLAEGEILLFLHADTRLPNGFAAEIVRLLAREGTAMGAFSLGIAGDGFTLRLIERVANFRSRCLSLPYGDQAFFLTSEAFRRAGGFPEIEIMEDFAFVRRLADTGSIAISPLQVATSARRWRKRGPIRQTFLNQAAIAAYLLGIPRARIRRWYG